MAITKKILFFFFTLAYVLFSNIDARADNTQKAKIRLVYFYSVDCPKCQKVKPYLNELKNEYAGRVEFLDHDVKDKEECRQLFYHFIEAYKIPKKDAGTPLVIVGDKYFAGVSEIENNLKSKIDEAISKNEQLLFDCHGFLEKWPNVRKIDFTGGGSGEVCGIDAEFCAIQNNPKKQNISFALIASTAVIDSINPCAIAVLVFLITVLVTLKVSRKRMITIGLFYIGAVFSTYYLAGIGIMRVITQFEIAKEIGIVAGMIVLLAGFLEVKEGLCPNGKQILRIPEKTKPVFAKFLKKATIPSVLIAGILVSAFELPCTGQVYLAILSMLSSNDLKAQGYFYLFIYNIIFVLPLVIILFLTAWGFDIKRLDAMRKETRMHIKIAMGIIMIILGFFLLFQDKFYILLGV